MGKQITTNSENKNGTLAWIMWASVCLYYLYQFFMRVAPTVVDQELIRYFSLTASSFGTLCGYYYFTYTFLQIPIGLMVDRYGPRLVSSIACIICGLGAWIFIAVPNYNIAILGRALTGIGSAAGFIATVKMGMNWFDKSYIALINTLTIAVGILGACAGAPVFAYLKQSFDWRSLLIISAGFGIVIGIFIYLFVKDYPKSEHKAKTAESPEKKISLWEGFKVVLVNPQCWLASIYVMFLYAPLSGFSDMWGVSFLRRVYDLDTVAASSASNMIYVGMVVGGPLFAWFSSAMEGRKICLWIGTLICLIAFGLVVFYSDLNYFTLSFLLFLVGLGLSGGFIIFTISAEIMPNHLGGTVIAFVNTFSMVSGVILQPALGWLLNNLWDGTVYDGVPFYDAPSYKITMCVIVACLFLGLLFIPFLKESFPKQIKSQKKV